MLQVEKILQKCYQLKTKLGKNAGRQTWLAQELHESVDQPVIVKLLAFNHRCTGMKLNFLSEKLWL